MSPWQTSSTLALTAVLTACAGAAPPPPTPPPPIASVAPTAEPTPSVAPAAPAPSASSDAPPPPPPEPTVVVPAAAPSDSPAPAAPEEALPPASADQKAFVTGQLLGTEVVFITVADAGATCESIADKKRPVAKGARKAELRVLWKSGYYDFSNRMAQGKLSTYQGTFWMKEDATQGGIQVRSAPLQKGGSGRIHLKASRPRSSQSMDAELDVTMCADIDFTKKGKH